MKRKKAKKKKKLTETSHKENISDQDKIRDIVYKYNMKVEDVQTLVDIILHQRRH